jgi:SOS-response transcriptional repressor LexA
MKPFDPLSARQRQLLNTIERMTADRGFPPTVAEAAREMKLHPSRIHQLAISTERKGFLTREPKTARSWRVTRPAPAAAPGR